MKIGSFCSSGHQAGLNYFNVTLFYAVMCLDSNVGILFLLVRFHFPVFVSASDMNMFEKQLFVQFSTGINNGNTLFKGCA